MRAGGRISHVLIMLLRYLQSSSVTGAGVLRGTKTMKAALALTFKANSVNPFALSVPQVHFVLCEMVSKGAKGYLRVDARVRPFSQNVEVKLKNK